MATTGTAIVGMARTLVGVPYHHQGRDPSIALDCVGLPVAILRGLGLSYDDFTAYEEEPDGRTLIEYMDRNGVRVPEDQMRPGDVLVFFFGRRREYPQHLGILTQRVHPQMFVHTHRGVGKVIETHLDERWVRRIHSVYRLRGVA